MNAKGDLIARLLALGLGVPTFEVEASGPAHERTFHVKVLVGGQVLGAGGEGRSKRDAERLAAESALRTLTPDGAGRAEPADLEGRPDEGTVWPIYAGVLEGALDVALELSDEDATVDDVRRDAARLYRDLLTELGHGPEDA